MGLAKFRGTGVALITPFRNKAIDYDALETIIEHVIQGGVDYLVSLGTTGEAITLSSKECREVFDFTIKVVKRRKPLVAGLFGSNFTEALVEKIRNYNLEGFDAIMSSSPAYSKPPQEGIFQHYMQIAGISPVPIIIYNVPGRTCSNVKPETIIRLAEKVESREMFQRCRELGFNLFQGYFFARPEIMSRESVDTTKLAIMGLLKLILANAEVAELEEAFKKSPTLIYKLLKLVNSAYFRSAGAGNISTVSRAILVLGFDAVRNLAITVLMFEHLQNTTAKQQLMEEFIQSNFAALMV